jgi:type IV secretion system protein VirD4
MEPFGWLFLFCVFMLLLSAHQRKQAWKRANQFEPENTLAGAVFAGIKELRRAGCLKRARDALRVGFAPDGRHPIFYHGVGHVLTVSAARWGKGIFLLIIALLTWANSVVVVDPKMELCAVTGRYRRRFGTVYVLDPFMMGEDMPAAVRGLRCVGFNPMRDLDPKSPGFHADCDRIASACVWEENGDGHHFSVAARLLVSGVIAALVRHGKPEDKNLKAVAKYISEGKILEFCREVVRVTNDPYILQKLGRFGEDEKKTSASKEIADVISTAITQLGFISGAVAEHLSSGAAWRWDDLRKKRGTSVYICVPLNRLDTHGEKYFRLVVESLLASLLNVRGGKRSRVLMILDEFAQLGPRMKSIENAMGMAAGACGLTIWCVLQDISQLMGMFPRTWQTFIQNCGVTMWGRARDNETREIISKLGGLTTVLSRSRNVSADLRSGMPHVGDGFSQHTRPLIHPHEAGALPADRMYLFMDKIDGPVIAKLRTYEKCGFSGYGKNPYFQKSRGAVFGWLFGK